MRVLLFTLLLNFIFNSVLLSQSTIDSTDYRQIKALFDEELSKGKSYENLRDLCKNVGARLSGSPEAQKAVEWAQKLMTNLGFDTVFLQEVMVPHWVRGEKETAILVSAGVPDKPLNVCALGGSVATPKQGIRAEVVEVKSFEELKKLGKEKLKGKIIFYNRPMNPQFIRTFHAYGDAVGQRGYGAVEAAKYDAIGVIVRSMTLSKDDFPHTGAMHYNDSLPKIPAVAISTNDADLLSGAIKKDKTTKVYLKLSCETLPDVKSYNVIGEIKGKLNPQEIIVVGGHLDSWDKGEGAHDDGAGCVQAIEVLHLFNSLKIKPNRTLRAVMFMNEENGLKGAIEYARLAEQNQEIHIAAIESDGGAASPRGFSIEADDENKINKFMSWKELLSAFGLSEMTVGYSGADIHQIKHPAAALFGLSPDSQRYFDYHHADTDVFEAIHKRELELGASSMAALVYLIDKYGWNNN